MNKLISALLMLLCTLGADAHTNGVTRKISYPGGKAYMFRVELKDKRGTPFSLNRPAEFLSKKAIDRRARQHLKLDSTDLPVNPAYLNAIRSTGVSVVSVSKWNNTVLVRGGDLDLLKSVALLGCVKGMRKVWTSPDSIAASPARSRFHTEFNRWDTISDSRYGVTLEQVAMLGGTEMHKHRFTGRGVTIAVLDGGYMNADRIPCLKAANVVGRADFVVPRSQDMFKEMDHGTKVLSTMAVNVPRTYVGTAPDATYWLLRCEDNYTESLAEEDYWAAAAEFADSVGADIISSSLGFHAFDDPTANYKLSQLDGRTALISRTAAMLAGKGIVKPDVMAPGSPTAVITGRGTIIKDVGTSFAAPLVAGLTACLWQALPDKTAYDIIRLVRGSADNNAAPDNIYGYGIPDFWKAYLTGRHEAAGKTPADR